MLVFKMKGSLGRYDSHFKRNRFPLGACAGCAHIVCTEQGRDLGFDMPTNDQDTHNHGFARADGTGAAVRNYDETGQDEKMFHIQTGWDRMAGRFTGRDGTGKGCEKWLFTGPVWTGLDHLMRVSQEKKHLVTTFSRKTVIGRDGTDEFPPAVALMRRAPARFPPMN